MLLRFVVGPYGPPLRVSLSGVFTFFFGVSGGEFSPTSPYISNGLGSPFVSLPLFQFSF